MALFHLLLGMRVDFCVAHVDHGWREESAAEAEQLRRYVEEMGVPFFLYKIEEKRPSELAAREERLRFFASLYHKRGCEALLLGHHADDQAETVLKRVLEGAHLNALGGMRQRHLYGDMQVWRPLLNFSKKEILLWMNQRNLSFFTDPTNRDPAYMRARMRVEIVPFLEASFGKKVASNLVRLGALAYDVADYLQRKSALFKIERVRRGDEVHLNFNPYYPLDSFELNVFLKHFFKEESFPISYRSLEIIQKLIQDKSKNKSVDFVFINNGSLFINKIK